MTDLTDFQKKKMKEWESSQKTESVELENRTKKQLVICSIIYNPTNRSNNTMTGTGLLVAMIVLNLYVWSMMP